jgi:hypothetical protein
MDCVILLLSWFCGDAVGNGLLLSPAEFCIVLLFGSVIATAYFHMPKERELKETEEAIKRIRRPV